MGEIAEMMLDGTLCEGCGEVFDDNLSPGYARRCSACQPPISDRQASQMKRASNRESSANILRQRKMAFESKNGGAHLIVRHKQKTADFWPGTGKFIFRGGKEGRGVFNLLKEFDR